MKNGDCKCKFTHQGDSCHQCAHPYTGQDCQDCIVGYFKQDGHCTPCNCNPERSSASGACDALGRCQCKPKFGGTRCNICDRGYSGESCEDCKPSYYKGIDGTCTGKDQFTRFTQNAFTFPFQRVIATELAL